MLNSKGTYIWETWWKWNFPFLWSKWTRQWKSDPEVEQKFYKREMADWDFDFDPQILKNTLCYAF